VPEAAPDHSPYTKRAMANVMIEIMEAVGHVRFIDSERFVLDTARAKGLVFRRQ
jgi:hypothetical protein